MPFWGLMAIHGGLNIVSFVESWFNTPVEPIPTLEEQRNDIIYTLYTVKII